MPFETRQAVLEERIAAEMSQVKQSNENARKRKLIAQQHKQNTIQLLGSEKYEKLRAYLKEQRKFKAKFFFPPRGPEMSTSEVERFQRERKDEALRWAREAGIDVQELCNLSRRTAERLKELGPVRPYRGDKRSIILSPSDVPAGLRNGTTPGIHADTTKVWTTVGPPYGWAWWTNGSTDGFTFSPTLYLDASIGWIGNINHLEDGDASDNDYGYIQYGTNVSFWYQMPTTGLVEVWIEAVPRGSHHRVDLWDEWGWSDSSVNQHSYLTLNASVGGSVSDLQLSETSWFNESGATDGHWDDTYFMDGGSFWANLVSDGKTIFPAGSWVLVEAGMMNWNSTFANDVTTYSTLDVSWVIKDVSVHSTGM